ncbi:MAG: serine/threonine-protein kinase [Gemmatimonadota bacterium]
MTDPFAALTSALRDRYVLDRKIGQGGMATVYLAEDVKHHRPVAIKVLRPELAATIGTERFLREIDLAAKLQHPHIVPVYDSGAADGVLFYVMPFIEGESLRDRLTRDGTLPLDESVRLTREVAGALQYAHERGIVHRDIKPENIMLSGGNAVVADFGIARAAAGPAADARLTGLGNAIGTPAYMSPEQATADEVDARSDEYALACVFFEMVTGRQAFTGTTMQALIASHLTGPRPRLADARRDVAPARVSTEIDRVVAKALATDRQLRYPDVMSFADALDAAVRARASGMPAWGVWSAAAALAIVAAAGAWIAGRDTREVVTVKAGAERIAVLPFTVSGSPDATLGEGMVTLLTTNLRTVTQIQTVDPQTVFVQWRKRGGANGVDLQGSLEIARATRASAALVGSVVNAGNRVRLQATLYGLDGAQLGAAQTEGASDSVLALVDDLSAKLVREIWKSREPLPSLNVAGVTTSSLPALRAYFEGEQFYRRGAFDSAQVAFNRAIAADSTFALAQYRLAMSYGWIGGFTADAATAAANAAERFSDRLPLRERTLVRAYNLFRVGKVEAADTMRAYLRAHPGDPDALYLLGESMYHGREIRAQPPESIEAPFEHVLAIDSTLAPALIHPLELAVLYRDSLRFSRYMSLLRTAAAPATVETWSRVEQAIWGNRAMADSMNRMVLRDSYSRFALMPIGLMRSPDFNPDAFLHLFALARDEALRSGDRGLSEVPFMYGAALVTLGRLDEAKKFAETLKATDPDRANLLRALPLMAGLGTPQEYAAFLAMAPSVIEARKKNAFVPAVVAAAALEDHDRAAADKALRPWLEADTTALESGSGFIIAVIQAEAGWGKVVGGDTTGGVKIIETALGSMVNRGGFILKDPVRFEYGMTLAARPATHAQGIAMLRDGFDYGLVFIPATQLALGRLYEQDGRRQEAIDAYQQFIRLWSTADARLQPKVEEAKDALSRLTAEGKK